MIMCSMILINRKSAPEIFHHAVQAVHMFLNKGIEQAMNEFNGSIFDEE